MRKIIRTTFAILTIAIVAVALNFVMTPRAQALIGISDPFGGRVITSIYCTASANHWITVGPPTPRLVMQDPGSILYSNYQPFTGHWVLGIADFFEPCLKWVCGTITGCTPIPIGGGERVRIMGTS